MHSFLNYEFVSLESPCKLTKDESSSDNKGSKVHIIRRKYILLLHQCNQKSAKGSPFGTQNNLDYDQKKTGQLNEKFSPTVVVAEEYYVLLDFFFLYSMGSLPVGVHNISHKLVPLGHSVQGASVFLAPVHQVVCPYSFGSSSLPRNAL